MDRDAPLSHTIIVRYAGELAIKRSAHFQQFASRLMNCIRHNFTRHQVRFTMQQAFSHLVIVVEQKSLALSILSRTFGISSYSVVDVTTHSELDAIVHASQQMIPHIAGKRFAVRAKRVGGVPLPTPLVERRVGTVLSAHGKVDLTSPEKTVHVEITNQRTNLFCNKIKGPGGLPANRRERCLVLLSGGFDSAVAAWKILKRGVACDYFFCNMGGKFHERQALQVAKVLNDLWAHGLKSIFIPVDFLPAIAMIKQHIPAPYRQIILKRVMYRVAEKMAATLFSKALVTGDSLGQVTSQSLQNIKVIDQAISFPIFRPLIGEDKQEIIKLSYKIGTGTLSEKVTELCGISQGQPVTQAKYYKVLAMEGALDSNLTEDIYRSQQKIGLDDLDREALQQPYLFSPQPIAGAKFIDCQESAMHRRWSAPDSLHIPFEQLLQCYQSLKKTQPYLLYCTFGTKAPYAAELMQQAGYEAYAFTGSVKKLKKICCSTSLE